MRWFNLTQLDTKEMLTMIQILYMNKVNIFLFYITWNIYHDEIRDSEDLNNEFWLAVRKNFEGCWENFMQSMKNYEVKKFNLKNCQMF